MQAVMAGGQHTEVSSITGFTVAADNMKVDVHACEWLCIG